ncbi:MAG: EscU/YscU/HrcU family type III secretion system export apparatus switch protein [Planctomycetes bacterium]|nr:EscU/YscU/HrcU family type III secretion system export apparatus switch protein [Planctomycetota bacterium]
MAEDRDLPASPRKRQEAREQGRVAKSSDLAAAAVLLGGMVLLRQTGPAVAGALSDYLVHALRGLASAEPWAGAGADLGPVVVALAPFAAGILAIAILVNAVQVGFVVTAAPFSPNIERLDPFAGLARMVSARSAVRALAAVLKGAAVAAVFVLALRSEAARLPALADAGAREVAATWVALAASAATKGAGLLLFLGLFDYAYERWRFERELSMTRQEVVEELKELEGDPQVREQRRRARRQTALSAMVASAAWADAVLVAPNGEVLALRHDEAASLLRVDAKGTGPLGERILARARQAGVPVLEDAELVRRLYRRIVVGGSVPAEYYRRVAEVLGPVVAAHGRGRGLRV